MMAAEATRLEEDLESVIRALGQVDWGIDRVIALTRSPRTCRVAACERRRRGTIAVLGRLAKECGVVARVMARLAGASGLPEPRVRRLWVLAGQLVEGVSARRPTAARPDARHTGPRTVKARGDGRGGLRQTRTRSVSGSRRRAAR